MRELQMVPAARVYPFPKIKELEDKLREQEQQFACKPSLDYIDALRATPLEGKLCVRDESVNKSEDHILRSSNLINCRGSQGSTLLKGNESLRGMRTKRLSRNSEMENNDIISTSLNDNRGRQSDPPKPFARVPTRTTKSAVSTSQRPFTHSRTSRDQIQGIKERDNKKRIWSR